MKKRVQTLLPKTAHTKNAYAGENVSAYFQTENLISMGCCIVQSAVVSYAVKFR